MLTHECPPPLVQDDLQVVQLDIDICRADEAGQGNSVLATAEQPIPLDTLSSERTFSRSDLIEHDEEWTVVLHVTGANSTQLQSTPLISVDGDISVSVFGTSVLVMPLLPMPPPLLLVLPTPLPFFFFAPICRFRSSSSLAPEPLPSAARRFRTSFSWRFRSAPSDPSRSRACSSSMRGARASFPAPTSRPSLGAWRRARAML